MLAKVHFFPLGNADTLRLDLADGRKVLVDYANMRCADDVDDLRCDLPEELRRDLAKARRNHFDAVCITHLDDDHCCGFAEFFWLEHAKVYQDDDRVRITELWVPAAAICEEGLDGDARLVRAEAIHRLKQGKGVLVFSRPERLKECFEKLGIDFESRKHLIVNAGKLVPSYTKEGPAQAEFFVHSPFGWRQDEQTVIDRNQDSIVMQVTFREGGNDTYAILGSDVDYGSISTIVQVTRGKGNDDRLLWDLMKLPHHCSYLSLGPGRGPDETKAVPEVKWLFETQGRSGGIIVSPSWPIPATGSKEDDDVQPPHRQAANHHRRVTSNIGGQFTVTMEYPSKARPAPFGYEITAFGIAMIIAAPMVSTYAAASTPRAG
ncbi:MBL fold metallo-hydrolase [Bradyrhizobium sp. AUGA SZCCT0160]|uniref:MBL fold metallo-hydrolase n=1 Tax=Bradyrhizobium sp. AUGA SZCCT0160 TaxID=2807662 RepID=UPI001BA83BCA|nr:MBL fold metallo-hydrolase [Bradyrhizobium sp. AUGA SZCCT0160]MBR1191480.1 MBL fold metallo-hydrolase [Bradyrhizobium sp. AUGA SZCCT0160]